jgi:hypothetical protein
MSWGDTYRIHLANLAWGRCLGVLNTCSPNSYVTSESACKGAFDNDVNWAAKSFCCWKASLLDALWI